MRDSIDPSSTRGRVLFGAAYYAEYQLTDRVEEDLDLMVAAGFTVIRVGESVWSTWEPRDGEFDLDWLQPVLDGAAARGIGVILGTPTYAVPPWLQVRHPEIAAERAGGARVPWGGRQEVDFSHPAFRFHAERVIRAVVGRYATHPAVIGYQVDNEPGLHLLHNHGSFTRFVERLKQTYGDPQTLNREWGLTYWSHRIDDWSQLWRPDGNTVPQYDLAWRRYQAALTTEFIEWQAGIVREYSRPEQFVTTCIAYPRPALDDEKLTRELDVTAGNPYYAMQDHLAYGRDLEAAQPWQTTGVWGLLRQADRMYSSKQARFLVTETNAQSIGGSDQNQPPYPGQLKQAALALISRGAAMVEYWHWHTLHFGTETYWGGILPHSQRPGRVYREIADIGAALESIGDRLAAYVPDADVAMLYSSDSKWAFEFFPPLSLAGTGAASGPDRSSYTAIFDAFYRGAIDAGAQVRILHASTLGDLDARETAARHPVLVAPALYVATDDELEFLRRYAEAGGHLVVGIRTGYGDWEARARAEVAPGRLSEAAGVWYDEFSNLAEPLALRPGTDFPLSAAARATRWADGLAVDDADVLAGYEHPEFGRFAAITTKRHGEGRISYIGTVPNPALARDLMGWAAPATVANRWTDSASDAVTVASGVATGAEGEARRVWFVHNWSGEPGSVVVPHAVRDLISGEHHAADDELALDPWSALVLADDQGDE